MQHRTPAQSQRGDQLTALVLEYVKLRRDGYSDRQAVIDPGFRRRLEEFVEAHSLRSPKYTLGVIRRRGSSNITGHYGRPLKAADQRALGVAHIDELRAVQEARRLLITRTGSPLMPDIRKLDTYGRYLFNHLLNDWHAHVCGWPSGSGASQGLDPGYHERLAMMGLLYTTVHSYISGPEGSRLAWDHCVRTMHKKAVEADVVSALLDGSRLRLDKARASAARWELPDPANVAPGSRISDLGDFGRLLLRWLYEYCFTIATSSSQTNHHKEASVRFEVLLTVFNELFPLTDLLNSRVEWRNYLTREIHRVL